LSDRQDNRERIVERLRAMIARGEPIVGGGAGTGLSAKCEEAGGIDLIVIYNSGRYRMAGRGSLAGLMPYGDANAIVMEMAGEVLPVVKRTPVLAGVCATDPFRLMDVFLDEVKRVGFAGVQNFPTVGLIDGIFRRNLEETGMSYAQEVEMIALAREKDLLTTPYVFSAEDAAAMARAGADIIVCHFGLTTGGAIGADTAVKLADCPALLDGWAEAALIFPPKCCSRTPRSKCCRPTPKKRIDKPKRLGDAVRLVARLGGYLGRSSAVRARPRRRLISACGAVRSCLATGRPRARRRALRACRPRALRA